MKYLSIASRTTQLLYIKTKFDSVLNNNYDYKMIWTISEIISDEKKNMTNLVLLEAMTIYNFLCFKYAPITSADVERSF